MSVEEELIKEIAELSKRLEDYETRDSTVSTQHSLTVLQSAIQKAKQDLLADWRSG